MKSPRTRLSPVLLLIAFSVPAAALAAQAPAAQPPASQSAPQPSPTASSILNPAISTLQQALDGIRIEKWKTSSAIRSEAEDNIASVRRDIDTTLPPLLAAADGAPDSVTQILPAYRNIEALYDVLLRISSVSRLAAPQQQSAPLEQAISNLEASRRTLGDQMQTAAMSQDQKVHTLQASLRAVPPPAPAPPPCPTPSSTAKKHKSRTKPKAKPVHPQSTTPAPQ
jgi:hypothetical protein